MVPDIIMPESLEDINHKQKIESRRKLLVFASVLKVKIFEGDLHSEALTQSAQSRFGDLCDRNRPINL
jgi:hypothetical protein